MLNFSNKRCFLIFATLLGALVSCPSTAQDRGTVKVMTYNILQGTDFSAVLTAQTPEQFVAAVNATLAEVKASNIPDRAKAVAHQIAITNTDLVGLEEATLWQYGMGADPTDVLYDPLKCVLDELKAEGLHYKDVVISNEYEVQGPLGDGNVLRATGRNVILARTDEAGLLLSNVKVGKFEAAFGFHDDAIGSDIRIDRSWGSIDVDLDGQSFTFIVTHLENTWPVPGIIDVLRAQAAELNQVAAKSRQNTIVAGDFNAVANDLSDPSHAVYEDMINYGFTDSWAELNRNKSGLTWPLINSSTTDTAYQRIDFVFHRGLVNARVASLAGDQKQDRVDNMWPSDHAGLRALLQLGAQ